MPEPELSTNIRGAYMFRTNPLVPLLTAEQSVFSKNNGFLQRDGHGAHSGYITVTGGTLPAWLGHNRDSAKAGLFPLGFDKEGIMYCGYELLINPHIIPDGNCRPKAVYGWDASFLTTNRNRVTTMAGHPTATNRRKRKTYWAASRRESGEYIIMDHGKLLICARFSSTL